MTAAERAELCGPVFASLAGFPVATLDAVAGALRFTGDAVLRQIGDAVGSYAFNRDDPWLATLQLVALRYLALDDELLGRLAGASQPPWPALVEAARGLRVSVAS